MEYLLLIPVVVRIIISLLGYKFSEWESESKFFAFAFPGFIAVVALVLFAMQSFSLEIVVFSYCLGELFIASVLPKGGKIGIWCVIGTLIIYLGILGS